MFLWSKSEMIKPLLQKYGSRYEETNSSFGGIPRLVVSGPPKMDFERPSFRIIFALQIILLSINNAVDEAEKEEP